MKQFRYILISSFILSVHFNLLESDRLQGQEFLGKYPIKGLSIYSHAGDNKFSARQTILQNFDELDKYLDSAKSPFFSYEIPHNFFEETEKKYLKARVKNGNLMEAKGTFQQYKISLLRFSYLCDSLGISARIGKKDFLHRRENFSGEENKITWKIVQSHRKELKKAFQKYKKKLELVLATEIVLAEQQKHLPRLFEEMQYLINMDGSPLDIYIFSYDKIVVFGDLFTYEKNRAILFDLEEEIPEKALKECIEMALQYHSIKHKPFLGKLKLGN